MRESRLSLRDPSIIKGKEHKDWHFCLPGPPQVPIKKVCVCIYIYNYTYNMCIYIYYYYYYYYYYKYKLSYIHIIWLVVSTPLKNILASWDDYSQYMEK